MVAGTALVTALAGGGLWVGSDERPEILLSAGTAWLASAQGLVTLVDGPSEQVIGNVRAQVTGEVVEVVQAGTSALVVDDAAGSVSRIDGATYDVTEPVPMGDGPLDVVRGGGRTVVVAGSGGSAVTIDPEDLSREGIELALDAFPGPGQAVVDADGVLWVVDGDRGDVAAFPVDGDPVRAEVGDGDYRLVTVQGRAVVVDLTEGRAGWLEDSGDVARWSCLDVPRGSEPRLLGAVGAPRVYAAAPGTGRLDVADLGREGCTDPIPLGAGGDVLGGLVQAGGFVMVPDVSAGQAVVVDPEAREVAARLDVVAPGTMFELLAKDGLVFYNAVQGEDAGLLHLEGGAWTRGPGVRKYSSAPSEVAVLAAADTSIAPEALPAVPTDTPLGTSAAPGGPTADPSRSRPAEPTAAGTTAPVTPSTEEPGTEQGPACPAGDTSCPEPCDPSDPGCTTPERCPDGSASPCPPPPPPGRCPDGSASPCPPSPGTERCPDGSASPCPPSPGTERCPDGSASPCPPSPETEKCLDGRVPPPPCGTPPPIETSTPPVEPPPRPIPTITIGPPVLEFPRPEVCCAGG